MEQAKEVESLRRTLRARSRQLLGQHAHKPHVQLERVAAWCREHDVDFERYGAGPLVESFEGMVAGASRLPRCQVHAERHHGAGHRAEDLV